MKMNPKHCTIHSNGTLQCGRSVHLWLALSAVALSASPARATITTTGAVSPAYNGTDDPWVIGGFTLLVGNASPGTLTIQDSAVDNTININGNAVIGLGATGTVTVSGFDGLLDNSNAVVVGQDDGTGNLTISDAARVFSSNGILGFVSDSSATTGNVTVTGSLSMWTFTGAGEVLIVGNLADCTGTLTLSHFGEVRLGTDIATLAKFAGSTGALNIGAAAGEAAVFPGRFRGPEVFGGAGTATINFNHTDSNYFFTDTILAAGTPVSITGSTAVNQNAGDTTLMSTGNTYTGGTTVEAGTLRAGAAGAFVGNTAYTVNGGSLDLNDFALTMNSLSGSGGTVDLGNADLVVDQASNTSFAGGIIGAGKLTKTGTGTLTLTGANTYGGGTQVRNGTLAVDGGSISQVALTSVTFSSGDNATLSITNGGTVNSTVASIGESTNTIGAVIVGGATSTWDVGATLFLGIIGTGTLTIQDGGKVNAGTAVSLANQGAGAGTINIGAGGAAGVLNTPSVNGGAGSATLKFNHSDADYFFTNDGTSGGAAVAITGSTAVNHIGPGTTTLLGNNPYNGATTVDAGTLRVDGSITSATTVNLGGTLGGNGTINGAVQVAAGGTLAPGGSPGRLTFGNGVSISGGTLEIEITGATPETEYDQLTIAGGIVNLGEQVSQVTFPTPSGSFALADRLFIIDNNAGATNGAFAGLPDGGAAGTPVPALAALGGFVEWRIYYHADSATDQLTGGNDVALAPVEPSDMRGDMNCDGSVDLLDIGPFALALTDANAYASENPDCGIDNGDSNCDGTVDGRDNQAFVNCLLTSNCACE